MSYLPRTKTGQIAVGLALVLATIGSVTSAQAGNSCKNVFLELHNDTGGKINVVDVDYWDPAKGSSGGWRSEPVKNETIPNGGYWRETRNLEKVNQRSVKVRFEYRKKTKFGWSMKKYKATTGEKTCTTRTSFNKTVR